MVGTLLAGARRAHEPLEWAESLDTSEGTRPASVWDRLGLWFVVAVVLVVIAYALPLWDIFHLTRYGSPGYKPF